MLQFAPSRRLALFLLGLRVHLTHQQANALVNTAIEDGIIGDLAIMVLGELHMIDEENRGYIMELLVTKLLVLQQDIQLVGMSATLSVNILYHILLNGFQYPNFLADLIGAKYYVPRYRISCVREFHLFNGECERFLPHN